MKCSCCDNKVKPEFQWFCHRCYDKMIRKYKITGDDFCEHVYVTCKIDLSYVGGKGGYRGRYNALKEVVRDIIPLSQLLENILFWKMLGLAYRKGM